MALTKKIFFAFIVWPLLRIVMGVHMSGREHIPLRGPAIIAANHNSHLDTLLLMSLFPFRMLHDIRPVGASDYFFKSSLRAFLSKCFLDVIPLRRDVGGHSQGHPFDGVMEALERGQIVVLYPEGSRGDPEVRQSIKPGIAHLARKLPDVPVVPVFIRNAGKSLPRGEGLLVPFICEIAVGPSVRWSGNKQGFLNSLEQSLQGLAAQGYEATWD